MKLISHLLTAVAMAIIILFPITRKLPSLNQQHALIELVHDRQSIEKTIQSITDQYLDRLTAFGNVVARERDFSMKLLVEQDATAPEVVEIASRYMSPMGFSVLDIIDTNYTVISSGHFPARAGSPATRKAEMPIGKAVFAMENLRGKNSLVMLVKSQFTCADILFYCIGGTLIDSLFLHHILPRKGIRLFLKHDQNLLCKNMIQTMSEIKDNSIIINDTTYLATSISLPLFDGGNPLQLIIVKDKPAKGSLLDLF